MDKTNLIEVKQTFPERNEVFEVTGWKDFNAVINSSLVSRVSPTEFDGISVVKFSSGDEIFIRGVPNQFLEK